MMRKRIRARTRAERPLGNPERQKFRRDVKESTIRTICAFEHRNWCTSQRLAYSERKAKRKLYAWRLRLTERGAPPRRVQFVGGSEAQLATRTPDLVVLDEDSVVERYVANNTVLRWLRAAFGIRDPVYSFGAFGSILIERLLHAKSVRVWYTRIKRILVAKCPFCGSHTVYRLCLRQTFRLLQIDLSDLALRMKEVLSFTGQYPLLESASRRVLREKFELTAVVWNKFAARAAGFLVEDIEALVNWSGVLSGTRYKLSLINSAYAQWRILMGGTPLPTFSRRVQESWRKRLDCGVESLVWNLWFVLDAFRSGLRGLPFQLLYSSELKELSLVVGKVVLFYYGELCGCGAHVLRQMEYSQREFGFLNVPFVYNDIIRAAEESLALEAPPKQTDPIRPDPDVPPGAFWESILQAHAEACNEPSCGLGSDVTGVREMAEMLSLTSEETLEMLGDMCSASSAWLSKTESVQGANPSNAREGVEVLDDGTTIWRGSFDAPATHSGSSEWWEMVEYQRGSSVLVNADMSRIAPYWY